MSNYGIIYFGLLIWAFILILNEKQKTGVLLYILYLGLLPFLFFYTLLIFEGEIIIEAFALSLPFLALIFGCGLLILRKFKNYENILIKFLKAKQLKVIFCSLFFIALIYMEFFNGVQTFQNKEKFFEFKNEIGIGHAVPYILHSQNYESGNVAIHYSLLNLGGYRLYIYNSNLYYYPISFRKSTYSFTDGDRPEKHWVEWGKEYNYRPD